MVTSGNTAQAVEVINNQRYFSDGTLWNAILEVFSEGCKPEQHSRTFFPDTGITISTPLQLNFESLFVFWKLFQNKIALYVTLIMESSTGY
jgi:hypothetical protein